jgi:hypothetical protein
MQISNQISSSPSFFRTISPRTANVTF